MFCEPLDDENIPAKSLLTRLLFTLDGCNLERTPLDDSLVSEEAARGFTFSSSNFRAMLN